METSIEKQEPINFQKVMSSIMASSDVNKISRPIANFHPCHWGDHFLDHTYDQETHDEKEQEVKCLKEEAKKELIDKANNPLEELNFIDSIERLGLAYHFEEEIDQAVERLFESYEDLCHKSELSHVSLLFRILRQHGFHVTSDVFKKFKDEQGSFKESLVNDIEGMLSLYEASFVRIHDDHILDEAIEFTTTHLTTIASELKSPLGERVAHALTQPLHRGIIRLESRRYMCVYEKDPLHNKALLKFAKLDFNLLQALHKKELSELARWWKSMHLNVPFTRDRSSEAYFWILGTYYEPQYANARAIFSKVFKMTSLLDDTYDAYGTFEELELLTEAIQRWDDSSVQELPEHVKWCYQALLETFKEIEDELAQQGGNTYALTYAKQQMKVLTRAHLQEAKWCNEKYIPTYDEYMEIGWVTSCYPLGIVASFLGMGDIATKEAFEWVSQNPMPKLVKASATIDRLLNDMGGHKFEQSRDHVASSVQCHISNHGAPSEEHAHETLTDKVEEAWKDLNEALLRPFAIPKPLLDCILNLVRVCNVIYKGEDGYTNVSQTMKDNVAAVLVDPIEI